MGRAGWPVTRLRARGGTGVTRVGSVGQGTLRARTGASWRRRFGAFLPPGALALLLVMAAGAAGVHPKVLTVVAPYKGTLFSPSTFINAGGCGTASIGKVPYWSSTKGLAGFATHSTGAKCPKRSSSIGGYSTYDAGAQFTVKVPLKGLPSGNHTIAANWTLTVQATEAAVVKGACPLPPTAGLSYSHSYCGVSVGVYLSSYAYMVDLTNGYGIPLTNSWHILANTTYMYNNTNYYSSSFHYSNYSVGGTGGFAGSYTFGWVWNASSGTGSALNSSHTYEVVMSFSGDCYAYVTADPYGYPTAHTVSSLNLGTLGNGWKLNFISVS